MARKVQVTVLSEKDGHVSISSRNLLFGDLVRPDQIARIVGDQARLCTEVAVAGKLLPTPRREGGRG